MNFYHKLYPSILSTNRAQERKLKGELVEVTEKYGEVCSEKVSLEDEIILLKDSSVNKDEHNKVRILQLHSDFVLVTPPKEDYSLTQN